MARALQSSVDQKPKNYKHKKCENMSIQNNLTISSCMYSSFFDQDVWQNEEEKADFFTNQITYRTEYGNEDYTDKVSPKPLRENNRKNRCKHVPHRDKPAQVVARRNARERRRVQAVNNAFVKLRKAIPIENTRGKRVSKVKTLQYAIEYINNLQYLLDNFQTDYQMTYYYCHNDELQDEI